MLSNYQFMIVCKLINKINMINCRNNHFGDGLVKLDLNI